MLKRYFPDILHKIANTYCVTFSTRTKVALLNGHSSIRIPLTKRGDPLNCANKWCIVTFMNQWPFVDLSPDLEYWYLEIIPCLWPICTCFICGPSYTAALTISLHHVYIVIFLYVVLWKNCYLNSHEQHNTCKRQKGQMKLLKAKD